jgi:hypothetical protein
MVNKMSKYIKSHALCADYLLVTAHGVRNSSLEVAEGALELYQLIEKAKAKKVLLDYREVDFRNTVADAFNVVRLYERMPLLKAIKLVTITNDKSIPLAKAWLEFAQERGFQFQYALNFEEAERWLLSK